MEILILMLVIGDIICLGIEHGIDRHQLCIEGLVVPVGPARLATLAEEHHKLHGDEHGEHEHDTHDHGIAHDVAHGQEAHNDKRGHHTHGLFLHSASVKRHKMSLAAALAVGPPAFIQTEQALVKRRSFQIGLTGDNDHHHVDEALLCETRNGPASHQIVHTLHMISITILIIMLVEILMKVWVNPDVFMHNPWEVLDLVVVSLSLIVDIWVLPMLHDPKQKSEAEVLLVLLIVVRFWRVVRIAHGFFEVIHHEVERVEHLHKRIETLETTMREKGVAIPKAESDSEDEPER